ncbi:hypothetical protein B6U80_01815 [Candidatus Pacearchaeota archaeon ex4484_26]|nr:MAG: hypothetical protein B6U80_01815 [Candidatus Pacearchaeota archaeon ex4484_26]RLG13198.1 MAG: hypothetical protein DRN69_06100 [Candidatus Pacearchaeota archaeon]
MQTSLLFKIALTTSLIGLLLLFFLSENLEPRLLPVGKIDEKLFDEYVKISGEIANVKETSGLYILSVKDDSGEISVILFKNKKKIDFVQNRIIEVIGKVSEYRGKPEIEAVEIRQKQT